MRTTSTTMTTPRSADERAEGGPLLGLGNLLANEHRRWWRSRRWLIHLAVWVGIVNGFLAFLGWAVGQDPSMNAETIASTKVEVFGELFPSLLLSTALGAIVAALGAIVGERQRGTAAWILSKPVGRGAFILAKFVAYATALIPLAVVAPATVFYGERILFLGAPPALGPHLAIVALATLHLLWYLSLTLFLGTMVQGHGAVAGVGLGVLFGGQMLTEVVPALALVIPHGLTGIARALSLGQALPPTWPLTVGAVVVTVAALIALTLWRFGREEF